MDMTQAAVVPLLEAPLSVPLPPAVPPLLPLLRDLVRTGVLTGYALLSVQGILGEVVGPLTSDLGKGSQLGASGLPGAASQFLRPFTTCDSDVTTFTVAGTKLLVVAQEPGYLLALGPRRVVCIAVFQLQQGLVLLATWGRSTPPPAALHLLDTIAAPFRDPTASSPCPSRPSTLPLVRLAWVKEAHRALRLAVTGIRSCRMRYHDQVEAGQQQMNQACNCLLQLQHLPSMPLGVLAGMPDVNKAAAKKLLRQVSHHVEQLGIACLTMQDVCVEVQQHVQDVESVMQEPWQRVDTTTFTPGLGLTQALAVLTQLVEPLLTDFHDKSLLSLALSSQANANAVVVAERVIGLETRVPEVEQPLSAEQLTQRSQVWLSVWMLSPKRDVDAEECLLGVLQEALAAAG